jgi:hypothetical protein
MKKKILEKKNILKKKNFFVRENKLLDFIEKI